MFYVVNKKPTPYINVIKDFCKLLNQVEVFRKSRCNVFLSPKNIDILCRQRYIHNHQIYEDKESLGLFLVYHRKGVFRNPIILLQNNFRKFSLRKEKLIFGSDDPKHIIVGIFIHETGHYLQWLKGKQFSEEMADRLVLPLLEKFFNKKFDKKLILKDQ